MRTFKKQTYTLTFKGMNDLSLLENIEDEIYEGLFCTGVVEREFDYDSDKIRVSFTTRQNRNKVLKIFKESVPEQYEVNPITENEFLVSIVKTVNIKRV